MSDQAIDETKEVLDGVPSTVPAVTRERRGLFGRLYHGETSVDFFGKRWWGFGFSIVLLLVSVGALVGRGLNLSLDFTGGVVWSVASDSLTVDDARTVLDDNGLEGSRAKVTELTSETGRSIDIQVGDQPDQVRQLIQEALAEKAAVAVDDVSTTSVSSTWGRSITEKAITALVVFLFLVSAFIWWRLEGRMATAAIAAMLHDVLLSVGIYALLGFEFTPATLVAFLTILGYSLYDTIVVFDKVQENQLRYSGSRMPYADIVNVSMNQVLMRSLNTTISSLLPIISLLVLGSGILGAVTLREFALALLIGMVTGSYSSIFVASPLVAVLKEREPRFRSLRGHHATGVELERLVLGGSPSGRRERRPGAAEVAPAVSTPLTAEAALTHTPRPRKKKRRT